jgi:hypothetical protein
VVGHLRTYLINKFAIGQNKLRSLNFSQINFPGEQKTFPAESTSSLQGKLPVPKFIGNYTRLDMEEEENVPANPNLQFKDWGVLLE